MYKDFGQNIYPCCIPTSKSAHFIVEVSTHFKSHFAKSRQQKRKFFNVFGAHNFFSEDVD